MTTPRLFPNMSPQERDEWITCQKAIKSAMSLMKLSGVQHEVIAAACLSSAYDLACEGVPLEMHGCVEHAISLSALEVAHTRQHIRDHWASKKRDS